MAHIAILARLRHEPRNSVAIQRSPCQQRDRQRWLTLAKFPKFWRPCSRLYRRPGFTSSTIFAHCCESCDEKESFESYQKRKEGIGDGCY